MSDLSGIAYDLLFTSFSLLTYFSPDLRFLQTCNPDIVCACLYHASLYTISHTVYNVPSECYVILPLKPNCAICESLRVSSLYVNLGADGFAVPVFAYSAPFLFPTTQSSETNSKAARTT